MKLFSKNTSTYSKYHSPHIKGISSICSFQRHIQKSLYLLFLISQTTGRSLLLLVLWATSWVMYLHSACKNLKDRVLLSSTHWEATIILPTQGKLNKSSREVHLWAGSPSLLLWMNSKYLHKFLLRHEHWKQIKHTCPQNFLINC